MSAKRKLWLSVASLCLVVILGVTSIAVVLASLSANVNNNFSITYTPHNVKATLAGSYNLDNVVTNMSSSGVPGAINFDGSETGSKNFDSIGNIELKKGQTLELNYTVINYDNEKTLPVSAELLNAPENLKVTYSTSLFNGTNTTTNSQTMTANSPTPTIEVPFSTYSTFDELKSYTTELDSQDCAIATNLLATASNNIDDFELREEITDLNPRTFLLLKWLMTFLIIKSFDPSNIYIGMNSGNIEWSIGGQLLGHEYTISSRDRGNSPELVAILAEKFASNLLNQMMGFIIDELLCLFIPAQLDQTSTSPSFSFNSYIKDLQGITDSLQYDFFDEAGSTLTTQGKEADYEAFLSNFQGKFNDFVIQSFPNYDNSPYYDFKLNPIKIDSNTKANLMYELCELLDIPCLYITIKFEIADTTLPASFNGGVNINLGKS